MDTRNNHKLAHSNQTKNSSTRQKPQSQSQSQSQSRKRTQTQTQTYTLRNLSRSYIHLELQSFIPPSSLSSTQPSTPPLDALTIHTALRKCLTRYFGLHGAAVQFDILHIVHHLRRRHHHDHLHSHLPSSTSAAAAAAATNTTNAASTNVASGDSGGSGIDGSSRSECWIRVTNDEDGKVAEKIVVAIAAVAPAPAPARDGAGGSSDHGEEKDGHGHGDVGMRVLGVSRGWLGGLASPSSSSFASSGPVSGSAPGRDQMWG